MSDAAKGHVGWEPLYGNAKRALDLQREAIGLASGLDKIEKAMLLWLLAEARWWAETRKPSMEHFVEHGEPPWLPPEAEDGGQTP